MYNKTASFRTTEQQFETLQKMRSYNIDVSRFIRDAIREKLIKDKPVLIPKPKFKSKSDIIITQIEEITNKD